MMQIDEKIKKGGQKMVEKSRKLEAGRPKIEEKLGQGVPPRIKKTRSWEKSGWCLTAPSHFNRFW